MSLIFVTESHIRSNLPIVCKKACIDLSKIHIKYPKNMALAQRNDSNRSSNKSTRLLQYHEPMSIFSRPDKMERRILLPLRLLAALLRILLLPLRILLAPLIILLRAIRELLRFLLILINPVALAIIFLEALNIAANIARIILMILRLIFIRKRKDEERDVRVITIVEDNSYHHKPIAKHKKKQKFPKNDKKYNQPHQNLQFLPRSDSIQPNDDEMISLTAKAIAKELQHFKLMQTDINKLVSDILQAKPIEQFTSSNMELFAFPVSSFHAAHKLDHRLIYETYHQPQL